MRVVQGGEDPWDALSLQVISRKKALYVVALLRKETCNSRHPVGLRHSVLNARSVWMWDIDLSMIYQNTLDMYE